MACEHQDLVNRLGQGYSAPEFFIFEEGELPRRLWRVTQRKTDPIGDVLTVTPTGPPTSPASPA